jgi:hypothetical protein
MNQIPFDRDGIDRRINAMKMFRPLLSKRSRSALPLRIQAARAFDHYVKYIIVAFDNFERGERPTFCGCGFCMFANQISDASKKADSTSTASVPDSRADVVPGTAASALQNSAIENRQSEIHDSLSAIGQAQIRNSNVPPQSQTVAKESASR